MNRTTLATFLFAAATALGAQEPPTPPRPAPAARPAPAPRPDDVAPAPRPTPAARALIDPIDMDLLREQAAEAARIARDASRIDVEAMRDAQAAMRGAQMEVARNATRISIEQAREMARLDMSDARALAPIARDIAREFEYVRPMNIEAPFPPMPAMAPMAPMAPMAMRWNADDKIARPFFQQGEPEDSVYRLAHDLLNRGDYGRAAQMFKDIAQKYPKSVYANDLPYYEAWARYKIGTTEELHVAAKLLEPRVSKFQGVVLASSNGSSNAYYQRRGAADGDVASLYARVNSALASRGDRDAADRVAKLAQAGANTCDREEMSVRTEAMSALTQMDPTQGMTIIRKVLDKKDDCTETLRQRAIFILGSRRSDAEAATLIATAAKSDPSKSVRVEAINWLPKLQGDVGVAALEDLLRTETDENIQRSIVRTLVSSDNAKARTSMRALIDRKDAPMSLRIEAINSYNNDRATTDDAAYLRTLYGKADSDRLKDAIIGAVARMGGQENDQWVLAIARNPNETSQARGTAISRLIRSNMPVIDIVKLYDAADNYNVRSQIVNVLGSRKEPEATDKLIEIAKTSTVQQLRLQAIQSLTRKNDPRASQLLLDIVDGKPSKP
jgi:TolA-binding protein/HEAT repeat protein